MICPVCRETALVMSERNGIEIDYCPQCRGVWLDRGELDKIIERAAPSNAAWENPVAFTPPATIPSPTLPQTPPAPTFPRRDDSHSRDDYRKRDDDDDDYRGRKRRKGSFLEELFDFD